jgi:acetoacetate decarboxylase
MGTPYPAAPWRLRGWAAMTLQPVGLSAARRLAPPGLRPVPVWPGKALGGLYVASYETGSTLVYHELVVVAAFAAANGRVGAWIPLIYVDDAHSLAGGHAIWSLPKELARFTIADRDGRRSVRVARGGELLCEIGFRARGPALRCPLPIPLPGFGNEGGDARFFMGRLHGPVALARVDVAIPPDSALAPYGLDRPRVGFTFARLSLNVPAPRPARRPVPAYAADAFSEHVLERRTR